MRNDLTETNWADEFLMPKCGNSVEDLWASFKSKIYELRNKFVLKTTVTGTPSWNKKGSIHVGKPIQVAIRQKKFPPSTMLELLVWNTQKRVTKLNALCAKQKEFPKKEYA